MEGNAITLQDIYLFDRKGIDREGRVVGEFRQTGIRPACSERIAVAGIELPGGL
jgi:pilus assembly protein CpaF